MTCRICGGIVMWRGPIGRLEFTQCEQCHAINCQIDDADEPTIVDDPETPEESEVFAMIFGPELGGEG